MDLISEPLQLLDLLLQVFLVLLFLVGVGRVVYLLPGLLKLLDSLSHLLQAPVYLSWSEERVS